METIPRRVTGQYLARAHLNRRQRARLAADLANGTAAIHPLTMKQAAALARVPVLDVSRTRLNGKPRNGATVTPKRWPSTSRAAPRPNGSRLHASSVRRSCGTR